MLSHRIVSPMLLGIKDQSGLGNNADEIKTASLLMDNTVIRPFQEILIDSFDQLLAFNDIALNLYFITLQPLEFTEVDPTIQDKEDIEEETGVQMALKKIDGQDVFETKEEAEKVAEEKGCSGSHEHEDEDGKVWYMPCDSHDEVIDLKKPCQPGYEQYGMKMKNGKKVPNCVPIQMSTELGKEILESLKGEKVSDEWVVVDELDENENISDDDWANICIKEKKSLFTKLKDEIYSRNNGSAFSYLDSKNYKIRYKYAVGSRKPSKSTREFCSNMMRLSQSGIVYRLEDIDRASRDGVNKQLGHKGKPYDLFKYKGGVYCRHKWVRVLYRLESNTEPSENLDNYKRTRSIPESYIKKPRGTKESQIAPVNMPNEGHYPGVK